MHVRERLNAVLHHQPPDQVPFAPQDNHLHRGALEREMRNRGAGLLVRTSTVWSEMPNVRVETVTDGPRRTTLYHTPVGTVSTETLTHLDREITTSRSLATSGMIDGPEDYEPVLFMIDDTVYYADNSDYEHWVRDLGDDGLVKAGSLSPPYAASRGFYGGIYGLDRWIYAQIDEPNRFAALVEALERRTEREFALLRESPTELVTVGSVNGEISPAYWERWLLPFYAIYVPALQAAGKLCVLHAHASNLSAFVDVVKRTGVDVVEAFTPPPVGDLDLADARVAWGPETVIWINFPETVYYQGPEATKAYTADLLRSDPPGDALVIGFTEMGQSGIHDDESERIFASGMRAMMDAIEEYGNYPIR